MVSVALFLMYITFYGTSLASTTTVTTPWGKIEGISIHDDEGNRVEAYLGIPFAEPPVGDLRFKKPVPHRGGSGTFNASTLGTACTQLHAEVGSKFQVIGEENCLTLNVYVPFTNMTSSPRAVMVWILGGGFIIGSASQIDPPPLATVGDVIVVTFQYRLGPFGFLSTMDNAAKGNYGLWDQLLALKWIKKNIGAFGGDPDQITIIGESAGAASVGLLTTSPEANGLFKKAILQSGSAASFWAIKRDPLPVTYSIAKKVGCEKHLKNHSSLVACMREVPAESIAYVSWPVGSDYATVTMLVTDVPYGPVVDGELVPEDPYNLLGSPARLMSTPFSSCDIMLGVNNDEGGDVYGSGIFYDKLFNTSLEEDIKKSSVYETKILPFLLNSFYGGHTSDMIKAASFEYKFPTSLSSDFVDLGSVVNTKTDASFLAPAVHFARTHASLNGTGKTYLYYFDHYPNMTLPPVETVSRGMHHAFDLYYTFGFSSSIIKSMGFASNVSPAEVTLSVTFRKILTQFAKFGDPSTAVVDFVSGTWPEFNTTSEAYLSFNDHMTVKNHVARRRVALWLDLLPNLQKSNNVKATGSGVSVVLPIPDIFG